MKKLIILMTLLVMSMTTFAGKEFFSAKGSFQAAKNLIENESIDANYREVVIALGLFDVTTGASAIVQPYEYLAYENGAISLFKDGKVCKTYHIATDRMQNNCDISSRDEIQSAKVIREEKGENQFSVTEMTTEYVEHEYTSPELEEAQQYNDSLRNDLLVMNENIMTTGFGPATGYNAEDVLGYHAKYKDTLAATYDFDFNFSQIEKMFPIYVASNSDVSLEETIGYESIPTIPQEVAMQNPNSEHSVFTDPAAYKETRQILNRILGVQQASAFEQKIVQGLSEGKSFTSVDGECVYFIPYYKKKGIIILYNTDTGVLTTANKKQNVKLPDNQGLLKKQKKQLKKWSYMVLQI